MTTPKQTEELLPCPFCGSEVKQESTNIWCQECHVIFKFSICSIDSHARRLFNTRQPDPALAQKDRPCTCHHDDRQSEPCSKKYALADCIKAHLLAHDLVVLPKGVTDEIKSKLGELSQLGKEGMKPDYNEWLTFHDKVAQVADAALSSLSKARGKSLE